MARVQKINSPHFSLGEVLDNRVAAGMTILDVKEVIEEKAA